MEDATIPAADYRLSYFNKISSSELLTKIKSMSSSFCSLDPMPPWLLIECFNELETVLLFVVNESLKIGYFPSILKKHY